MAVCFGKVPQQLSQGAQPDPCRPSGTPGRPAWTAHAQREPRASPVDLPSFTKLIIRRAGLGGGRRRMGRLAVASAV